MFGSPQYLWLLLAAVPLLLLHLRRYRRERISVGSVMHWARAETSPSPEPAWWRVRVARPFLLRFVVLVLLVLAAAEWRVGDPTGAVGLVLDSSPSMRLSLPDGRARLDTAKGAAVNALRSRPDSESVMCAVSGDWPSVIASGESATYAADVLENWAPRTDPEPPVLSLAFAAGWLGETDRPDRQLIYVGDAAMTHWPELPETIQLDRVVYAAHLPNAAVLDIQPSRDRVGPRNVNVFFRLGQIGVPAGLPVTWALAFNGITIKTGQTTLEDGGVVPLQVRFRDNGEGGALRVILDAQDACKDDNAVEVAIPPFRPIRVLLRCRPENRALRLALSVLPDVEVVEERSDAQPERVDVHVVEGEFEDVSSPGLPLLRLAVAAPEEEMTRVPSLLHDWDDRHPILEGVDLPSLGSLSAVPRPMEPGRRVLARGQRAGWIAIRNDEPRAVEVNFDLRESGFSRRPDFPVFISNCIHWLAGQNESPASLTDRVEAIDPIRPPLEVPPGKVEPRTRSFPSNQPAWSLPLLVALLLMGLSVVDLKRGSAP